MAEIEALEGISRLPEPVIHHILSFLTPKEAAKTSLLSKAWLSTWYRRPTMEFNDALLDLEKYYVWGYNDQEKEYMWAYNDGGVITEYLRRLIERYREQNIVLETFKLQLQHTFDWNVVFEKATKLVLENGVRNLDLFVPGCTLPEFVLGAESLIGLMLRECKLIRQPIEEVRCRHLKRLCLNKVSIDEVMFRNIISSSQLIEILEISYCPHLGNFKLAKVRNLKQFTVVLFRNQKVEIEAPSLELLSCSNDKYYVEEEDWIPCWPTFHTSQYQNLQISNLHTSQYQNLKNLSFCGVGINDMFFINFGYKLPHVEDLSIKHCRNLERIQISSDSLKRIKLEENWKLKEVQLDLPCFVCFEYESRGEIIPHISIKAASARWLSCIWIHKREDVDTSWFLQLKKFLANLIESEISLSIDFGGSVAFNIDEVRNSAIFPEPQEVQQLSVDIDWEFSASSALSILDGIFWICRPKTIRQHWDDDSQKNKFLRVLYKMVMFRRIEKQLYNLQEIKFWQLDLKEVEVENFDSGIFFVGGKQKFFKKGPREQQLEALNWGYFLFLLRSHTIRERLIYFNLDWTISNLATEKKRLKTSHSKLA